MHLRRSGSNETTGMASILRSARVFYSALSSILYSACVFYRMSPLYVA